MLKALSLAPLFRRVRPTSPGIVALVLSAFLVFPAHGWSSLFESEGWHRFREIHIPRNVDAGTVGVALESSVIENSRPDLADIRVVSSAGEVVPATITDSFQSDGPTAVPVPIFRIAKRPGKWTDLWIDKKTKSLSRGIVIQTSSRDFVRKVEIRGSDNGVDEYVIHMDGLVFDIPGPVPSRSFELLHPVNNFRYIHLRFLDGDQPPLKLEGTLCCLPLSPEATAKHLDLRLLENRTNQTDGSTVLVADLGEKRFPINGLKISTTSPAFVKRLRLLKGSPEEPASSWQPFHEGTLFRVQRAEASKDSLHARFSPQSARYVLLELSGAGPVVPVKSLEATAAPRIVIFDARPDLTYRLFYGNPQAKAAPPTAPAHTVSVTRVLAASSDVSLREEQKYVPAPRPAAAIPRQEEKPSAVWKIVGVVMLLTGLLWLFGAMLKARSLRKEEKRRGSRLIRTGI
jgi:hypothetical protein